MSTGLASRESTNPQTQRVRTLYRYAARLYDPFRTGWSRLTRPIETALDGLFRDRIGAETRVLELAPGTGINVDRLLRLAPEFASYLGVDASGEMLERARVRSGGDPRIELRRGDVTDPEAIEGRFGFIVSTWMLSHIEEPAATIRSALGHLDPGGSAVFVFLSPPANPFFRRTLARLGGPLRYRPVDPAPLRDLAGFERLESAAGGMATLVVYRAAPAAC